MAYERTLEDVENFVFDLDGTVWRWNRLKEGVQDTIESLQSRGKEIYYMTNNSILRREQYAEKLTDLGLDTTTERILPVSTITADVFDDRDIRKVYTLAEEGFRDELRERNISHTEDADHVLVAADRNFSYWKMAKAAELVRDGATFWCTSTDAFWQAGDRTLPGAATLGEGVRMAADSDAPQVLGKPSDYARDAMEEEWNLRPTNTVLIGDNIASDMVVGSKMGFETALVLGGTSTEEDLNDAGPREKPGIVFREFERILMKV